MCTVSGSVGRSPAGSQSAGSVPAARPTSVAMRLRSAAIRDSMTGMAARVRLNELFARSVSNAVPRPAVRRSSVSDTVRRWFSELRRATASCCSARRNSKYVRATSAASVTCTSRRPCSADAASVLYALTVRFTRPNTSSSHDASKPTSNRFCCGS